METLTTQFALSRIKRKGILINSIIDVGASDGRWSAKAAEIYPESTFLLIEANSNHRLSLENIKKQNSNFDYIIAAAGEGKGQIFFYASDLFDGIVSKEVGVNVTKVTIDSCIESKKLKSPFLLKVNTNGSEISILKGAKETLKEAEIVVVETYNYLPGENFRLFEICSYMEGYGFRCIDIAEPLHRIRDRVFSQVKLFFIPSDHQIFNQKGYQ